MADHMQDTEDDTLSLSDLDHIQDHSIDSEEVSKANQTSSSSSSSSSTSSSSSDQDFLGFFAEDLIHDPSFNTNSPDNFFFCGRLVSSQRSLPWGDTLEPKPKRHTTNPLYFRSSSDSFRFMRSANASSRATTTSRSRSLPASSSFKSKWPVFTFGVGSGRCPTKMDMSDIKSRQLRRQCTTEESVGRRSGKNVWWRLVDVLGCTGGYDFERDAILVI